MRKPQWLKDAEDQIARMPEKALEVREAAELDLYLFARLVNPGYVYGLVHRDIFRWLQEYNLYGQGGLQTDNKLVMLPRAHLKSHIVATWCAWMCIKHPEITILYVSATAELANSQLFAIKNILDSDVVRKYWPEYIHPDVGKREKWSSTAVMLDHPERKKQGVRDATIKTAGLTTNTTGWHADIICADDLVVPENAYTEEGRESVSKKTSQFTSIRNAGGFTVACGTRYHPADIYATWKEQTAEMYDEEGAYSGKTLIWDIVEHAVEKDDIFLWPRTVREDGKAFGFNKSVLARVKAEYTDRTQFYAQYYNDPNDPDSERMGREVFQYYFPRLLKQEGSTWTYNGKKLNVYAAVDFAYSLANAADFTAIVVVGVDSDDNYYILDIDRFKTFKVIEYFQHIKVLHAKWNFKKLHAEVTAAQKAIVDSVKDYVRKDGLRLSVVEYRPSAREGSKEERIAAVLEHRYENYQMWHREGGWTMILEDELILSRPAHDDIKDALASAVSIATPPAKSNRDKVSEILDMGTNRSRFGGYM